VDADAHQVTGLHRVGIERLEGFVDDHRRAEDRRRGRGEHVEPARRDHRGAERNVARIDEMNAHATLGSERAGDILAQATEEPASRNAGLL
jgi:hypothetical protein